MHHPAALLPLAALLLAPAALLNAAAPALSQGQPTAAPAVVPAVVPAKERLQGPPEASQTQGWSTKPSGGQGRSTRQARRLCLVEDSCSPPGRRSSASQDASTRGIPARQRRQEGSPAADMATPGHEEFPCLRRRQPPGAGGLLSRPPRTQEPTHRQSSPDGSAITRRGGGARQIGVADGDGIGTGTGSPITAVGPSMRQRSCNGGLTPDACWDRGFAAPVPRLDAEPVR